MNDAAVVDVLPASQKGNAQKLILNVDKTEFIVFRPPRKTVSERFTLKLILGLF